MSSGTLPNRRVTSPKLTKKMNLHEYKTLHKYLELESMKRTESLTFYKTISSVTTLWR